MRSIITTMLFAICSFSAYADLSRTESPRMFALSSVQPIEVEQAYSLGIQVVPQDIFIDSALNIAYLSSNQNTLIFDLKVGKQKGSYLEKSRYKDSSLNVSPDGSYFLRQGLLEDSSNWTYTSKVFARNPNDQDDIVLSPLASKATSAGSSVEAWFTSSGKKVVFKFDCWACSTVTSTFFLYDLTVNSWTKIFEFDKNFAAFSFDTLTNTLVSVGEYNSSGKQIFKYRQLDEKSGSLTVTHEDPFPAKWYSYANRYVSNGYLMISFEDGNFNEGAYQIFSLNSFKWIEVQRKVGERYNEHSYISPNAKSLLRVNETSGILEIYDTSSGQLTHESKPTMFSSGARYAWWGDNRIAEWKSNGELIVWALK